ncbi:hypothetical protein BOTBODRAFT_176329 [Botryobasidium botryosum FD-172 SS1]|uniref:SURP motif domain-containing protein n=1 Tax=Botryobasidium botryosum (strain FD-172 SS1) TaxID=930990 RepID=A0A067MAP7_BOTB1|nr:hypothetical protein BOTBODRAFT_176329 [Botryobasidium botryosum FD-172 SS1]
MAKRKRTRRPSSPSSAPAPPHPSLFIQAYESALVKGQPGLAQAVERRDQSRERGGLIKWQAEDTNDGDDVLVDRFDARLLLTSFSDLSISNSRRSSVEVRQPSPVGWDDLPSDSEKIFHLSPSEAEDYLAQKQRDLLNRNREDRLRALRAEDEAEEDEHVSDEDDNATEGEDKAEVWGNSDEEASPTQAQKELMNRTVTHILSSPNPAQLEMRILANHGHDPRFAFLRGRWKRAWERMKKPPEVQKPVSLGLLGLAGYEDSDEEDENEESAVQPHDSRKVQDTESEAQVVAVVQNGPERNASNVEAPEEIDEDEDEEEREKRLKRKRAEEWARNWKLSQAQISASGSGSRNSKARLY